MTMNAKQIEDLAEQIASRFDPVEPCNREYLEEMIAPLDREDQRSVMRRVLEIINEQKRVFIQVMEDCLDEAPLPPLDLMRRIEEALRPMKKAMRKTDEFLEKKK
jgi:hypothetical protein